MQQRFELLRRLGSGAMGVVHEALDRETGERVALKTLRTDDPYQLVRFKNEFRALQDLRHPNLVQLGELIQADGEWSFTMELVDGVDFLRWVYDRDVTWDLYDEPQGLCDEGKLRAGLAQLTRALVTLHDAGKVHRDVKPSNIMVEESGRLVLLDFGFVAGVTGDPDLEPGWTVGTPDYMAPEQARGQDAGPPADMYAVGTLLFQALTRTLPFTGSSGEVMMEKQQNEPPPPSELADGVPPDLDELCVDLLRVAPGQRPSGRDVLTLLNARETRKGKIRRRRSEVFVGRRGELARLRAAFQREPGTSATVALRGESGVGKSALAHRFGVEMQTEHRGTVVLVGHCYERESVPYKAVDELVDAVSRHLMKLTDLEVAGLIPADTALLARVFPVLRRLAPIARMRDEDDAEGSPRQRSRLFEAVRSLFRRLAESAPLLVIVEDLQWADADSRAMLQSLMADPAPPLMLITTARGGEPLFPGAPAIELGVLNDIEARELAERLGGKEHSGRIAASAGGHPLLVEEMVWHAKAGGAPSEFGDMAALMQARLASLPVGARHIMEVVSVAGAPIEQEVAARAAGMDFGPFQKRVTSLRAERLVRTDGVRRTDPIAPFHDHVRAGTLASLARQVEAGVHEAIALALEATKRSDEESLARHWRSAGHPKKARDYTIKAAKRATNAFAFARAADLFRAALELEPPPDVARKLHAHLGEVLAADGRALEAAEAYLEAVANVRGRNLNALELRRRAADQLLRSGHIERGLEVLRRVLAPLDLELPEPGAGTALKLVASTAMRRFRGIQFEIREEGQLTQEQLMRVDVCWTVAMGIAAVDSRLTPLFQARHLELALEAGEPMRVGRALTLEAIQAAARGVRLAYVDELIEHIDQLAAHTHNPYLRASALMARASRESFAGRWRASYDFAERADNMFRTECADVTRESSLCKQTLLTALFHMGELREADAMLLMSLRAADEVEDRFTASALRLGVRNAQWLARDDPGGARHQIDDALHGWPRESFYYQHYMGLFARCNVALYEGNGDAAWQLINADWEAARRAYVMTLQFARINMHYTRGRAAIAVGKPREAERDARKLAREGLPYAAGYALLIDAAAARLHGNDALAVDLYRQAAARFSGLDMVVHEAIARRWLGVALGDDEGAATADAADERLIEIGVHAPERFAAMWAPPGK